MFLKNILLNYLSACALFLCCTLAAAQDAAALARELVTIKGGYVEKKRHLEDVRIRAYIPILLKAVGKGQAWKPGHPNWVETERRIAEEWRTLYVEYLTRLGRDVSYHWMDEVLAREYTRAFSDQELAALLKFYRSPAGETLISLEREFLGFFPHEMLRSLGRVMLGNDTFTSREQESLRSPEARLRRDFVMLFESEKIIYEESVRIGGSFVDATYPLVRQGAIATSAESIDALRRKLDAMLFTDLQEFLKSEAGRKERAFLSAIVPNATPLPEDPVQAMKEEAVFYKDLEMLSARWRELAAK